MAINQAERIVGVAIEDKEGIELVFDFVSAGAVDHGEGAGETDIGLDAKINLGRGDIIERRSSPRVVEGQGLCHLVEEPACGVKVTCRDDGRVADPIETDDALG